MPAELEPADVANILSEHKQFFESQQTRSIAFRIAQLKKLKAAILAYESKLMEALYADLGKSEMEAYSTEIGFVLGSFNHTIKHLNKWSKPRKVRTPLSLFPAKSEIITEPYGTVLIIGPYNYPFQLLIEPLIGAIAAGNCAVLKPSELVPHVSKVIMEMIAATFDEAYIRTVEGGVETNKALTHAPFDYIFFTGSVAVGKMIMEAAAHNLVPVTLELGGKSPVIVDESADIEVAATRIIWGKMLNAGQTCIAPDYMLVHQAVKDRLIAAMKSAIQQFYGLDAQASKDLGRIVNDRHFARLQAILEKDKQGIIYGGSIDQQSRYIEPTLIEVSSLDAASMSEEIFGPILPIISYTNLDQAIAGIKTMSKPLALYLFTTNKQVKEKVLLEVSSGGVAINDTIMHLVNPELPFGGVGSSGIGAYHGSYSYQTFSHQRSILSKGNKVKLTALFPPYSAKKLDFIRKIMH